VDIRLILVEAVSARQRDDRLRRHRARQKEPLALVTVQSSERVELVIRFYALTDHGYAEGVRHRRHCSDDRAVTLAGAYLLNETSVDLQDVNLHSLQVRERRVASSEVVQGNAHTE
jgi:hypothetical protein